MTGRALLLCAVLAAASLPARGADVLVLEGGRRVEVDRWWLENGMIVYEKYGGTIGIPKSSVLDVLEGDDGPDQRSVPARQRNKAIKERQQRPIRGRWCRTTFAPMLKSTTLAGTA